MPPKPLEILRKDLDSLKKKLLAKRDHQLAQLADKKSISSLDKHWLDNDANLLRNSTSWILWTRNPITIEVLENWMTKGRQL